MKPMRDKFISRDLSSQPSFFRLSNAEDHKGFSKLLENKNVLVFDTIFEQVSALLKKRNPEIAVSKEVLSQKVVEYIGRPAEKYGVWVYFPWSNKIVHILDENEFDELRTKKNENISPEEQLALAKKKVGIAGLAFGKSMILTLASQKNLEEIRIAEAETLTMEEIALFPTGLHNLGIPKSVIIARQIAEASPFLKVVCFPYGLSEENSEDFFLKEETLDILFDGCTDPQLKLSLHAKAKTLNVPVLEYLLPENFKESSYQFGKDVLNYTSDPCDQAEILSKLCASGQLSIIDAYLQLMLRMFQKDKITEKHSQSVSEKGEYNIRKAENDKIGLSSNRPYLKTGLYNPEGLYPERELNISISESLFQPAMSQQAWKLSYKKSTLKLFQMRSASSAAALASMGAYVRLGGALKNLRIAHGIQGKSKATVLYLGLEQENTLFFQISLTLGFDVLFANSTMEAFEILHSRKEIHIIIADQKLASVDFFEILSEHYRDPVRILLGEEKELHALTTDTENLRSIYRYLKKPINETELKISIENALEIFIARKKLYLKTKELLKTNEELNRFVYSASHDLKAPLLSIKGLLNVAKLEGYNKDPEKYFLMMTICVKQLEGFIENIISYYKNIRLNENLTEINFTKIIQEVLKDFQFYEETSQIHFKIEINKYEKFICDEYRIRIILINLISNAIKYQKPNEDKKSITIKTNVTEEQAILIIEDNGIGIAKPFINDIYKMFYRATRQNSGSGLGLYIVKEALAKVGGHIQVSSAENVGSRFIVQIPSGERHLMK
jgi:two-component system sensor histidine kinase/response regulator